MISTKYSDTDPTNPTDYPSRVPISATNTFMCITEYIQSTNPKDFPSLTPSIPSPLDIRKFSSSFPLFLIIYLPPPYSTSEPSPPPPPCSSNLPTSPLRVFSPAKITYLWICTFSLNRSSPASAPKKLPATFYISGFLLTYSSITGSLFSPLFHASYTLHPPFLYNKNKNIIHQSYPKYRSYHILYFT